MTPEQARARFASARVATLATLAAGGRPRLVPIAFALDADTLYSVVDQKPKRTPELQRLRDVRADPRVCLLADHYDEDWSSLWWARAEGTARVLDPAEPEARRAIDLLAARYPQQRAAGAVLAVDVARWSGWSAAGPGAATRERPDG